MKRAVICTLVTLVWAAGSVAFAQSGKASDDAKVTRSKHSLWSLLSREATSEPAASLAEPSGRVPAPTVDVSTRTSRSKGAERRRLPFLFATRIFGGQSMQGGASGSGRPFASPTRPWAGPTPP